MIIEKRGKWLVYDVNGNYKKFTSKQEAEKAAGTQALDQMYEYSGADNGIQEEKENDTPIYEEEINDEDYKEPEA